MSFGYGGGYDITGDDGYGSGYEITGDASIDVSANFDKANTPAANQARQSAAIDVAAKAANGQPLNSQDAITAVVGAISTINPEAGAAIAVGFALLYAFNSATMAAFHELGWDARGVEWKPCDNPPSGPEDPRWYPDLANRDSDNRYWGLDKGDLVPGTFPAYAVPALRANFIAWMNCRPAVDGWILLRQLAEIWNAIHDGPESLIYIGGGWQETGQFGNSHYRIEHDILRVRGYVNLDSHSIVLQDPRMPEELKYVRINSGPLKAQYKPRQVSVHALQTIGNLGKKPVDAHISNGVSLIIAASDANPKVSEPAKAAIAQIVSDAENGSQPALVAANTLLQANPIAQYALMQNAARTGDRVSLKRYALATLLEVQAESGAPINAGRFEQYMR